MHYCRCLSYGGQCYSGAPGPARGFGRSVCSFIQPFASSFVPLFIRSLVHSFECSFIQSVSRSYTRCDDASVQSRSVSGICCLLMVQVPPCPPLPIFFFFFFFFDVGTSSLFRLVTFSILCFAFFSFPASSAICLSFCLLVGFL